MLGILETLKIRRLNNIERNKMKIGCLIVLVICFIIGLSVLGYILYPVEQAGKIYQKTLNADNVIYNYEYFKQTLQDVKAFDRKIIDAEAELFAFKESAGSRDKWGFEDKQEFSRLTANITGLKNVRNDIIATYNARAKMVNRSIFMGTDVPEQIN